MENHTIYIGLAKRETLFGVPRKILFGLILVFIFFWNLTMSLLSVIPAIFLYLFLVWGYKKDPFFVEVYFDHFNTSDHYYS